MKIKFLIALLLGLCFVQVFSQDTIYKTNGSKLIVKVTEVNANTIKYKFVNNGTELIAETNKSEIAHIVYAGGLKEIYNSIIIHKDVPVGKVAETTSWEDVPKPSSTENMKNIIAINCFEMLFTNFSFSYERIFKKGKFSFKIPVSFGLGGKPNQNNYTSSYPSTQFLQNKLYSGGLEFNIYPFGQTRNTFYIGLSGVAGSFNYYIQNPGSGYPYYTPGTISKYIGSHYAGMLHIGGYLAPSENILIGAKFGAGYKREETIILDYTLPKVQCDLNLAYRF